MEGLLPVPRREDAELHVNDDKGFYHCFGCHAHGDVIRWMTDQRGLPFMDAVKELAGEAGMEVPAAGPARGEAGRGAAGLHDVMAAAQAGSPSSSTGSRAPQARAYLESRGITRATAPTFGFGFAPDARGKLKAALKSSTRPCWSRPAC